MAGEVHVAHTGDVHLEEDRYFGDAAQCLEWFVCDGIRAGVALFVINGDLTAYKATIKERNRGLTCGSVWRTTPRSSSLRAIMAVSSLATYKKPSRNAPHSRVDPRIVQITYPFHPLSGREFELVSHRKYWAEDRAHFCDEDGRLRPPRTPETSMSEPVLPGQVAVHVEVKLSNGCWAAD